jgi:hypothetical protein
VRWDGPDVQPLQETAGATMSNRGQGGPESVAQLGPSAGRVGLTVGTGGGRQQDLRPKALALLADAVIIGGNHCSQGGTR